MVTLKAHILPHHDLQPPGCRGSFREAIATESTEEVRFHYVFIDGYWKVMYRTPEGWKMKALALALRRCPK